ncbi:MAG: hypothetical protein IKF97_00835 [Clostridia bacterium]|nr:hypothetical protein [Clostridia bacterium]
MKNNKKTYILLLTALVILFSFTVVYADPNSSKGFASFSDDDANIQTQQQLEEQEELHNVTEIKSTDNYLESLKIEGYTLTPEFDKQTLEYTIKENVTASELKIEAKASNEKATIDGIGTVKIEENKNEYRIDVTAESGTVRTYIIKIHEDNKEQENLLTDQNKEKTDESVITVSADNQTNQHNSNNKDGSTNIMLYITIGIILIIIIAMIIVSKKNRKKGKHKNR